MLAGAGGDDELIIEAAKPPPEVRFPTPSSTATATWWPRPGQRLFPPTRWRGSSRPPCEAEAAPELAASRPRPVPAIARRQALPSWPPWRTPTGGLGRLRPPAPAHRHAALDVSRDPCRALIALGCRSRLARAGSPSPRPGGGGRPGRDPRRREQGAIPCAAAGAGPGAHPRLRRRRGVRPEAAAAAAGPRRGLAPRACTLNH
jgi:hypothetical protein